MSRRVQANFSAGEIDPALHERTNFEKYNSGLKTARNVFVGKTGRLISRQGTKFFKETKYSDRKCIIYSPPFENYIIEWGHFYVRIHDITTGTYSEDVHSLTEDYLPFIEFVPSKLWVYIFCQGQQIQKMVLGPLNPFDPFLDTRFLPIGEIFHIPPAGTDPAFTGSSGTGDIMEYVITGIQLDGQETLATSIITGGTCRLPINVDESTGISAKFPSNVTKAKVYRRPQGGGAFGFVTDILQYTLPGGGLHAFAFSDKGLPADYSVQPPSEPDWFTGFNANARTGAIYQQRLVVANSVMSKVVPTGDEEGIFVSQTGNQNNFWNKIPLSASNALSLKAGTSGKAKVLRLVDTTNGLVVFTTAGVYVSEGALTPENLTLTKRGRFVISENTIPLEVPGNLLFVDSMTNTIRNLLFDDTTKSFPGEEISIFSNHLFLNKEITSWAFQDGDIPVVWVTQDDGSLLTLTYQREHAMQAWTRHDSHGGLFESVTVQRSLNAKAVTYFVVKRGDKRFIECMSERFTSDIKDYIGMDCATTFDRTLNALVGGSVFEVLPEDVEDWSGTLSLISNVAAFNNAPNEGAVGTTWRVFDSQGSACDLTVVQYLSPINVRVQPSVEFNGAESTNLTLHEVTQTISGLDYLEGQEVSVLADGYVLASPLNDASNYEGFVVTNGSITLPKPYAIVHVGLPYTCEIETLDVDTVEQKPVQLDAKIVSQVNIKIYNTVGVYVSGTEPVRTIVKDMRDLHYKTESLEFGNIGNACDQPVTRRESVVIPKDWNSNGRILLRQVDPLPFEILSIIPDYTIV